MPPEPDYKSPESCPGGNADRSIAGAQARLIAACPRTSREEFRLELRNYNGDLKLRFGVFKKNRLGEFEETSRAVVFSPLILRDVKDLFEQAKEALALAEKYYDDQVSRKV